MRSPTKAVVVISLGDSTEIQLLGMFSHKERSAWWERICDALDAAGMEFAEPLGYPEVTVPVGQRVEAKSTDVLRAFGAVGGPAAWQQTEVGVVVDGWNEIAHQRLR